MESRLKLALRGLRVLLFCVLYFGSFTASLYLSHHNVWWRVALVAVAVFSIVPFISSSRQRSANRRKEILSNQLEY
jgi:membrane protein YdbS with pleckstrin-like domain